MVKSDIQEPRPFNLLYSDEPLRVRVIDFGIARSLEREDPKTIVEALPSRERDHHFTRSYDYATPEEFEPSDVYSFGMIAYCLLSQGYPVTEPSPKPSHNYLVRSLGQGGFGEVLLASYSKKSPGPPAVRPALTPPDRPLEQRPQNLLEVIRSNPAHTVKAASLLITTLSLSALLLGKLLDRLVLAPDVGIVLILLSLMAYLMARVVPEK